jgi:hypothetical protein
LVFGDFSDGVDDVGNVDVVDGDRLLLANPFNGDGDQFEGKPESDVSGG